jgi:1-acyl-sn-glycerol-3-phosphate acyltransferase
MGSVGGPQMSSEWIAAVWLIALAVAGLIYFVRLFYRSDYSTWESCLYLPTYLLGRLLWRVQFTNQAPSELQQGAIMAANHRSSVDPFFVQLAARRRVHWMVAQEYCRHVLFGPLLRALQVIPTNRSGTDTASTKAALRITQAGRLVGMFPEGKINRTSQTLLPLRAGAALVAMRSQVPLIPLWIEGSPLGKTVWSPLFMPARVCITFGQPIYPDVDRGPASTASPNDVPSGASTSAPGEMSDEHSQPAMEECDPTKIQRRGAGQLAQCDALIVQWGIEIQALAGRAGAAVQLASQRKLRNRSHE